MPGNWVNVPFTAGQRLDAADLNDAFENVRTNATAQGTDDYSASVAQGETTIDPGDVGTEVLATSVAEELAQLRFIAKSQGGGASWRARYVLQRRQGDIGSEEGGSTVGWDAALNTNIYFRLVVPEIKAATDMVFKLLRRHTSAAGTAIMNINVYRDRDGTAHTQIGSQSAVNFTPGDTNTHVLSATLPMASFSGGTGDIVLVVITRVGTDAGDTATVGTLYQGHWFEFQGVAGRP